MTTGAFAWPPHLTRVLCDYLAQAILPLMNASPVPFLDVCNCLKVRHIVERGRVVDVSPGSVALTMGTQFGSWVPQVCPVLANLGPGSKPRITIRCPIRSQVSQPRRDLGHPAVELLRNLHP